MNLSRLFILRPIATTLLMLAVLFVGALAYRLLPVSSLPQVDYPIIRVATFYPGASPEVMTSLITAPLEKQFGQMPGLAQMTSSSSSGASLITLQFSLNLSLDVAEQQVQAAINAANTYLPSDLSNPPVYSKVNPADAPIMTLALTSNTLPLTQVGDYAETRFAQKISQVSGVGLVSISGGQRPAVRIQLNPTALATYGLTLDVVRTTLISASTNQPKGNFDGPQLSYTINANDQLLSAKEYENLVIAYLNKGPLRLKDVATVIDGVEDTRQAAWFNETPAVILNIQRQPGSNVLEVADNIKTLLPKLQASLPASIKVTLVSDRTQTIRESAKDAEFDLMLAVILVVAVIYVFLGSARATLIPSVAVPLSLIGTFGAMYLLGFSVNNLTLMALTIATGFVVDDAIVMIENISRYLEQGESPLNAALKGASQIGFTILSLTVSLIGVLIPLLFMGDVVGRLFREFALTLSVTILISAVVSLSLTPMMCARILKEDAHKTVSRFQEITTQGIDRLIAFYARTLAWVLTGQPLILLCALGTVLLSAFLVVTIPKGFFPQQDTGVIQGVSQGPESISFPAMARAQERLVKDLLQDLDIQNVSSFVGIDSNNTTLNSGRFLITLKPADARTSTAQDVVMRLRQKFEKASPLTVYLQSLQDITLDDRVSRTQYQYSLTSPTQDDVSIWSKRLVAALSRDKTFQDVNTDIQENGLAAHLTLDRDSAARLGITAADVDNMLYNAFGQRQILTLYTQFNQYYVILEVLPAFQQSLKALDHLYLQSSAKKAIPLGVFATISEKKNLLSINRQGQFPVAVVSFNLGEDASLGAAVTKLEETKNALQIPAKIQTSLEGTAKIFESSLANQGFLVLAAVLVVYIVLGVLYESFIHPVTILSTLPSAGMGALLSLFITGRDLSVVALIGIILLIGIVMKNAIMMIDFALDLERKEGKAPYDAIYEACLLRFRPILMTTLAALFGAVPLAVGSGMGAELRSPLGIAIIGGLVTSQLLTLYTTPVIYLTFDRLARALTSRARAGSAPLSPEKRP